MTTNYALPQPRKTVTSVSFGKKATIDRNNFMSPDLRKTPSQRSDLFSSRPSLSLFDRPHLKSSASERVILTTSSNSDTDTDSFEYYHLERRSEPSFFFKHNNYSNNKNNINSNINSNNDNNNNNNNNGNKNQTFKEPTSSRLKSKTLNDTNKRILSATVDSYSHHHNKNHNHNHHDNTMHFEEDASIYQRFLNTTIQDKPLKQYQTAVRNIWALAFGQYWTTFDDVVILGCAPTGLFGHVSKMYEQGARGVVNLCEEYSGPESYYKELGKLLLYMFFFNIIISMFFFIVFFYE